MKKAFTHIKTLALAASMLTASAVFAEEDKDTTIVIPESGHLAIKPSRNFTGPKEVIASNFYGSGNASSAGLVFNNARLDTVIISVPASSSSAYILTAAPGTYQLTYTDRTATKNYNNSLARWTEETGPVTFKTGYRIYKFVNTPDHVGFEVDANYADEDYQHCDMAEGEHLYIVLQPTNTGALARIAATLDTTVSSLTFIPWSDKWGCPSASTSTGISTPQERRAASPVSYDLQGRRLSQPQKGIQIQNGKKYIVK